MPAYPIDKKLVIAVSSSALFDLTESDKVFREQGAKAYKVFQEEHLNTVLGNYLRKLGCMGKRNIFLGWYGKKSNSQSV